MYMDKFAKRFGSSQRGLIFGVLPKIRTYNVKVGSSAMRNVCYIADLPPPRGIICYIANLPEGRSAMGEGLLYNTGNFPALLTCNRGIISISE